MIFIEIINIDWVGIELFDDQSLIYMVLSVHTPLTIFGKAFSCE